MQAELAPTPPLEAEAPARPRIRSWIGQLAGLLLLLATIHYVEPAALLARISQLQVGFIAVGTALVVPQLHCLALRWRLTAAQLGFPFAQRQALREYGLSMLLNLLLPFGIAGDALRVLRHSTGAALSSPTPHSLPSEHTPLRAAEAPETRGVGLSRAFHGVVLERMLGQVVVIVWAVATLPLWFGKVGVWLSAAALGALAIGALLVRRIPRRGALDSRSVPMRTLLELSLSLQRLLGSRRYLGAQFALSSVITLTIAAQLYCALGALGLTLSAAQASQVFPLMLLSMTLPLAFAGFGPREAVTAELYDILQLSAADGAAFALAFGAILICTSLPCLLLVLCLSEHEHAHVHVLVREHEHEQGAPP
ncbi:MAG TPA: lysylphosphatidylglycerol synthase transmembrane domain-containing protein [Polyangiales bacterium]|nr:lysylphosphatidylglycerol synthase transmembrane domain-containing protein [Polyangiales bacterium]